MSQKCEQFSHGPFFWDCLGFGVLDGPLIVFGTLAVRDLHVHVKDWNIYIYIYIYIYTAWKVDIYMYIYIYVYILCSLGSSIFLICSPAFEHVFYLKGLAAVYRKASFCDSFIYLFSQLQNRLFANIFWYESYIYAYIYSICIICIPCRHIYIHLHTMIYAYIYIYNDIYIMDLYTSYKVP